MKRLVFGAAVAGMLTVANTLPTSLVQHITIHAAGELRASTHAATAADIVATARAYLGYPYATIGDSPKTGFSCIGFVHFVFAQNGINVPYDIPAAWNSAPHVQLSDLLPGDVLFYSNTVFAGLSHVAIYIGNGEMIGADNFQVGVHLDNVQDTYWMDHYYGATRPLAALGVVPATQTQDAAPTSTASATPIASPIRAGAPAGTHLQVLGNSAAVYSGPGYQYTTIASLPAYASVTVIGAQAGWYDVRYVDPSVGVTYGFIYAGNLGPATPPTYSAAAATVTPIPTPSVQLSTASAVSGANASVLIVARGPLNIRSGPGKNFAPVGSLKTGARVVAIEQRAGWAHVQAANGLAGWVALQYLTAATPGAQQATSTTGTTLTIGGRAATVTATMLYVRVARARNAAVLTVLFSGEIVRVLDTQGAWDEVQLRNGHTGWASADYLRIH